ncbi:uncharacterized protein LODBEIA_P49750 [Lodderomyces beijingensis]|uniref:FYVE-type domain-containing protein n=1 Tax=Lodderomyces beijingensis TaxID=1775926 RepID=A0ABP0ZRF8_9ASCO
MNLANTTKLLGSMSPEKTDETQTSRRRDDSSIESEDLPVMERRLSTGGMGGTGDAIGRENSLVSSPSTAISRAHWRQPPPPSSQQKIKCKLCERQLNGRNGCVNCRKCGDLFCNAHTQYTVKLRNPEGQETTPQFDSSSSGSLSRCCETCYYERTQTTYVHCRDLTDEFTRKRREENDFKELQRTKVQRNFIKLTNLMLEKSQRKQKSSVLFALLSGQVDEDEKSIVGANNWASDTEAKYCSICFSKFNFIIRKHHCRLCGAVVCDDSSGVRKSCSLYVPLNAFLVKLPGLNYSKLVRDKWDSIDDELRFRCCVNCKNAVLHDWKREHGGQDVESNEIFRVFEGMLLQKQLIERAMNSYENNGGDGDVDVVKWAHKLVQFLKQLESSVLQFKKKFFFVDDKKLLQVQDKYVQHGRILLNMFQSISSFLQDTLVQFKAANERNIPESESASSPTPEPVSAHPRLTKKQIRELREQLMVLNEQKYLVETQIHEFTRNRKFDELETLIANKDEILETITSLEQELGEFAF